jgi:hypothetical protein
MWLGDPPQSTKPPERPERAAVRWAGSREQFLNGPSDPKGSSQSGASNGRDGAVGRVAQAVPQRTEQPEEVEPVRKSIERDGEREATPRMHETARGARGARGVERFKEVQGAARRVDHAANGRDGVRPEGTKRFTEARRAARRGQTVRAPEEAERARKSSVWAGATCTLPLNACPYSR